MGSTSFGEEYRGPLNLDDAYQSLVDAARSEYGWDPYNGTISTSGGVSAVPVAPMSIEDASALSETRIEKLSKWGPCEAIPLLAQTPAEYAPMADQRVTVTVSGAVYNDPAKLGPILLHAATGVKGAELTDYRLERDTATVAVRVESEAPKEKSETRFFVLTRGGNTQGQLDWDKGYPTQAIARAALDSRLMHSWRSIPDVQAEIVGITRRVSGAPLVRATVSAKKITGTFVVSLRRQTKAATVGTVRDGFYFYGWAAC